jgi:GH25 family lysozyme M1 (1,4-beta-N-acetylmuramidase)
MPGWLFGSGWGTAPPKLLMDVFIPDISEWQVGADTAKYRASGGQAIIARVCYGTRNDAAMVARRDALRAEGFPVIGWYLFLRASEPVMDQVLAFQAVIPQLGRYEFVVVDWESDGSNGPRASVAMRDAVLNELDVRYGRSTWGYGYAGELQAYPFSGRPTWVAGYGIPEPSLTHVLWQFTDGRYTSGPYKPVTFPGIGAVDASVFHGTIDQLKNLINPLPAETTHFVNAAQEDGTMAIGTAPDGKRVDRVRVLDDHTVAHDWQPSFDAAVVTENLGGWATRVSATWAGSHFLVEAVGQGGVVYRKVSDGTTWVADWTAQGDVKALP